MAPSAPIMRIGSSLSGAPTAPSPTSTGPTSLPKKPAGPPPALFDRASAFKERLQATKARADAALPNRPSPAPASSAPPRAGPPRPPIAGHPSAAPLPPAAQPSPYSSPPLVYPIGGPRTTSAPPAPSTSSPAAYAPTSPRQPAYGAYGCQQSYAPQQYYQHSMPSTATPFHLPSPSHPRPHLAQPYPSSFANPYAAYPSAAPPSAPAYPPHSTAHSHDAQTWPAPEIEWRRAPPPAPPVPAGLTSDGRATDYGAAAGGGEGQERAQVRPRDQEQKRAPEQAQAPAHEPASPRARRRSSTAVPRPGGFVSAFEGEFGGANKAREGALGLCGLAGLEENGEGGELEGELLRVWRDKVRSPSSPSLDFAAEPR